MRGPAKLFEDILDPSRNVDPAFQRATVTLKSGEEVVGCNLQTTPETVTISEIGGKVLTYPKAQVAGTRTDAISLMPPVFEQSIKPDDLGDLVAYLIGKNWGGVVEAGARRPFRSLFRRLRRIERA